LLLHHLVTSENQEGGRNTTLVILLSQMTGISYKTLFTYTPHTHLHVVSQQQSYLRLFPVTAKILIFSNSSLLLVTLKSFSLFLFNPSMRRPLPFESVPTYHGSWDMSVGIATRLDDQRSIPGRGKRF
jgi:hypothetical protein